VTLILGVNIILGVILGVTLILGVVLILTGILGVTLGVGLTEGIGIILLTKSKSYFIKNVVSVVSDNGIGAAILPTANNSSASLYKPIAVT
jgi:hypothetical protein